MKEFELKSRYCRDVNEDIACGNVPVSPRPERLRPMMEKSQDLVEFLHEIPYQIGVAHGSLVAIHEFRIFSVTSRGRRL